jgi:hypothetical protein
MLFSIRKIDPHPPGAGEWEAMTEHGAPEGTPFGKETTIMNTNRTSQTAADQQLADGLTKNAGILGTFGFGGKQLKPADVVQVLQGHGARHKGPPGTWEAPSLRRAQARAVAPSEGQPKRGAKESGASE